MPKFPIFRSSKVKRSNLSREVKIDLIVKEISKNWLLFLDHKVTLHRTKENDLDICSRDELLEVLEYLQNAEKIIKIAPENYPKITRGPSGPPFSGDPTYDEKKVPETAPLTFEILQSFDNWLDAYRDGKNKKFSELLPSNLKKVGKTILDIYAKFDICPSPHLTIPWYWNSEIAHPEVRKENLEFLKRKGIVKNYHIEQAKGYITVEVDVKKLREAKNEVLPLLQALNRPILGSKKNTNNEHGKIASLKLSEDLKWKDIEIKFINHHDVRIKIKGEAKKSNFGEMGFENKKNQAPNIQWQLLHILANKRGRIQTNELALKGNLPKTKQLLAKSLRAYFKIDSAPFTTHKKEGVYETRFKVSE